MFAADLEGCNQVNEYGYNAYESYNEIVEYYKDVSSRPDFDQWVSDNIDKNSQLFDSMFSKMLSDWFLEFPHQNPNDELDASYFAGWLGYVAASCAGIVDENVCNEISHSDDLPTDLISKLLPNALRKEQRDDTAPAKFVAGWYHPHYHGDLSACIKKSDALTNALYDAMEMIQKGNSLMIESQEIKAWRNGLEKMNEFWTLLSPAMADCG